jgi:hypothetical protein
MKPLKSGLTFANWLLRISLAIFLTVLFIKIFKNFDLTDREFYIASIFIICGILLFIAGFMPKPSMTVISGIVIAGLSIYKIVLLFSGTTNHDISSFMITMAIGFYFACAGNE